MLRAAAHCLLVTPTGDDTERERGRLIVVNQPSEQYRKYRGVIESLGVRVGDGCDVGDVAIYTGFHEVFDGEAVKHVVPVQNLLCFETSE